MGILLAASIALTRLIAIQGTKFPCNQPNNEKKYPDTGKQRSQKKLGMFAGIDEFVASSRMSHCETGRHLPDF